MISGQEKKLVYSKNVEDKKLILRIDLKWAISSQVLT
jgi:hypothetical protein